METELTRHLKSLAIKYEKKEFLIGDPSWFMHQIEGNSNKELLSFIASSLSYGSRKQFLPKIQLLLDHINAIAERDNINEADKVSYWLTSYSYKEIIPQSEQSFYRLYTFNTFNKFLSALSAMVKEYGTIKTYLTANMKSREAIEAIQLLTLWFNEHGSTGVIPKNTASSCKRICMFLRWMTRTDSLVDLGLWADIIDKQTLIIPLDTHVVQEANKLGLINTKSTSMSTAVRLTEKLKAIFPDDPLKGDFALFGTGVS